MDRKILIIFFSTLILFLIIINIPGIKNKIINITFKKQVELNSETLNKKKYLIECKLTDEIIERSNIDRERQCYYFCDDNDIVRVDTSIGFMCQPFILEER